MGRSRVTLFNAIAYVFYRSETMNPFLFLSRAAVLIGMSCALTACAPKDKPLPLSQDNMEKLASAWQKRTKALTPDPAKSESEQIVSVFKTVVEDDLGYSFDKTLRSTLVFGNVTSNALINAVMIFIGENPQVALSKGFISQRTFDLQNLATKARMQISPDQEKFLSFVTVCQEKNGGLCDSPSLLSILLENKVFGADTHENLPPDERLFMLSSSGYFQNTDVYHMGYWITKPDGKDIAINRLISMPPEVKFIVNKDSLAISKRYAQLIEDEKVALSQ